MTGLAFLDKTKNIVNVIHPYKTEYGYWVFDDADVGLVKEPFVGSINDILDILTEGDTKCTIFFSKHKMPFSDLCFEKVPDPSGGFEPGWYKWMEKNISGWLCPALLKYFDGYPEKIYIRINK